MDTENTEERIRSLELEVEHVRLNRQFLDDAYQKRTADADHWFDLWQKAMKDVVQALTYASHLGNCEWFQEGDTCTCGLFDLMHKYALSEEAQ